MEVYKTQMGYYVIIENPSQIIDIINELGNCYTIGLSPNYPKKNNLNIFINAHAVRLADRVGDIWINSIQGKFDFKKEIPYGEVTESSLQEVGRYW
jgi:hypothetical protein